MPIKNVLFICVENACRSQLAEAFANIHGQGIIKAYSTGSQASGVVNSKAITAMRDRGYDLSAHTSKSLSEIPNIEYDYIVTLGCGDQCPTVLAKHRYEWQIPDPKHMQATQFCEIRDQIETKVVQLIEEVVAVS